MGFIRSKDLVRFSRDSSCIYYAFVSASRFEKFRMGKEEKRCNEDEKFKGLGGLTYEEREIK